jgi:Phytochelatin synthase
MASAILSTFSFQWERQKMTPGTSRSRDDLRHRISLHLGTEMRSRGILLGSLGMLLIGGLLMPATAIAEEHELVTLTSPNGEQALWDSTERHAFVRLSAYFVTQDTTSFCGPASCTMVLNALCGEKPMWAKHERYQLFTQDNFFSPAVQKIVSRERVTQSGVTLDQLGKAIEAWPVRAEIHHSQATNAGEFRTCARKALDSSDKYVLVNYLRTSLGQEGGGHISPLAAYHVSSDRFLIMDVARYKYQPVWVPCALLWDAMSTIDADSNESRGFVVVSRRD